MAVSYNVQHGMSAQPAAPTGGGFGSAGDWATILSGISQGAQSALQKPSHTGAISNKKEAREAKRRTAANLLTQALSRNRELSKASQQYAGEMNETQGNVMQQIARGFIGALQGSTR